MGPAFHRLRTLAYLAIGFSLILVFFHNYSVDALTNSVSDLLLDGAILAAGLYFLFVFARRLVANFRKPVEPEETTGEAQESAKRRTAA